ncbi:MAG: hypothetical protein HKN42_02285 [Granulosicoccus sp.]|nr:hypothetical protein [Granulosicoccus sp.]
MLIPLVAQGSDLERLTRGIKRQAALTLLDLNQRLTGGVTLTDQQETCVGSYDPALGEKLLAIDCLQPLATGNTPIYTSKVAFYDSENCHISISLGNTVNCQLAYAALSLPTEWTKPANGPPAPVYPGSEIRYAIDDTMLHIENAPSALTGLFKCDIDLTSGTAQTPLTGQSCPAIITSVADRIDTLLPAE